ncbi:DMP19 family protein [Maribacter sp. IgM3_T14_3]|uniref:DMP19 family protein n=1 Tax=Maribacter sp. IgM3_T14_3 TaxID=3415140 RepID=UPI003C6FEF5D
MKILIGIIIVGLAIFFFIRKNSSSEQNEGSKLPSKLYSINDGNQNELLISIKVKQEQLDSIKAKYDWNQFDEYDNRMWEYMYKLFDETIEKSGIESYDELWNKLTRQQKVFWAFLSFNGDTDNGGVYQFIFNRPEFIIAAAEAWEELEIDKLKTDYNAVLNELTGKTSKIGELKSVFNDESKSWNKRWNSFADGYKELKSTEKIEDYYYDKEFKKTVHKKVADYIELNIEKFTEIEK